MLADEPATSCYLPRHRVFPRWLAGDSETGLPAVLMDSAEAGSELGVEYPGGGMPAEAPVPLPAGHWRVRATQAEVDEENWVGLVQLLPVES